MWHASAMMIGPWKAEAVAEQALYGVGDSLLGEWRERHKAFHIRKRLSDAECDEWGLHMIDMRNTPRGTDRMLKLFRAVPQLKQWAIQVGEWS